MIYKKLLVAFLLILLGGVGCSSSPPLVLPATQERDELLAKTLLDPEHIPPNPVHAELAAQFPIRPWSDLAAQVDGDLLEAYTAGWYQRTLALLV